MSDECVNQIKISVIIPVYNVEKYLRECLDSVVNQTLKEIEIILVDDGSTDLSGEICDEYAAKDGRIKVIHKENEGQGIARNVAIDIAKGDYLGFIDSDDWIDLDYYEKLYKAITENDADIAKAFQKIYKDGKEIRIHRPEQKYLKNSLNDYCMIQSNEVMWDKLFKKQFIIENNIKCAEKLISEDLPFTFKAIIYSKKIVASDETYYFYRLNLTQTTVIQFNDTNKAFNNIKIFDICRSIVTEIEDEKLKKLSEYSLMDKLIDVYFVFIYKVKSELKPTFFKLAKENIKNCDCNNPYFRFQTKIEYYIIKYSFCLPVFIIVATFAVLLYNCLTFFKCFIKR